MSHKERENIIFFVFVLFVFEMLSKCTKNLWKYLIRRLSERAQYNGCQWNKVVGNLQVRKTQINVNWNKCQGFVEQILIYSNINVWK